mgnify:CR=1 FL=1
MNISKLLLTREKYQEEAAKNKKGYSTFEIKTPKQVLFYFGANHSRNPQNLQYKALRNYWNKFLKITQKENDIVLIEGTIRPIINNLNEAIKSGSEGNFITTLAFKENIPVVCADLNNNYFVKKYPKLNKDEILLYWFLNWLNNFQNNNNNFSKNDFENAAKKWCRNQQAKEIWKNKEISLSKLKNIYKKFLNKDFNEKESVNNLINPNRIETPINKIARLQSDARDENIVKEILKYWRKEKNIFAVFGRGHLIIQKQALKKLLK